MRDIIAAITPGLIEILGVLLTGIIAWAASKAREKWGIDIEARHREALQSALMTGARLALSHELTGQKALNIILNYVRQSVPDAIGKLNPDPDVLMDLAKSKLEQAVTEKTGGVVDKLTEALKRAGAS